MPKGEQTRQRIIEQAASLFNQKGYEGCSIQDIMTATGLEKGGIYRHFENKEELAAEAFDFAWNLTSTKRRNNLQAISNQADQLKQHIANFVTRSGLPGGCPLLNTAVDSDDGNAVLRERVKKALRNWQAMLRNILEDGMNADTIRTDVDAGVAANHIIANLEGALLISRIERSDVALEQTLQYLDVYIDQQIRKQRIGPDPSN